MIHEHRFMVHDTRSDLWLVDLDNMIWREKVDAGILPGHLCEKLVRQFSGMLGIRIYTVLVRAISKEA